MENMSPMTIPNVGQVLDIFLTVGPMVALAAILILSFGLIINLTKK